VKIGRKKAFFIFGVCSFGLELFAAQIVRVADFGAFPDDGKCDRAGIAAAIENAKANSASKIVFESGIYELDIKDVETERGIHIANMTNLTFEGTTDVSGAPSTTLLRKYKYKPDYCGGHLLLVADSPNFTLKNFIIDNSPQYMTAGEIVKNDGESIFVRVFEGNPFFDKTIAFCGNLWDKKTGNLLKKGSVTYGASFEGVSIKDNLQAYTFFVEGDPEGRLLKLTNPTVAKKCVVGEVLSWHFGWRGYQVYFLRCDNLALENVWTHSAIGFCMQAAFCRNVRSKNVKFLRVGNQMAVGSRDAWKLLGCRGIAVMENMYIDGVRWDGQNVHGFFAWVASKIDSKTALFANDNYGIIADCFKVGSKVGFVKDDRQTEVLITITSSKMSEKPHPNNARMFPSLTLVAGASDMADDGKRMVEVAFEEEIPDWVNQSTVCNIYGVNIDSYLLINSEFKNIAGTASLIRNDNAVITGCTFDHIMYPAICVGGALEEIEGVVSKNVNIANNIKRVILCHNNSCYNLFKIRMF